MDYKDFKNIRYVCNAILDGKDGSRVEVWTSLYVFPLITANKLIDKDGKVHKSWNINGKWYNTRKSACNAYKSWDDMKEDFSKLKC